MDNSASSEAILPVEDNAFGQTYSSWKGWSLDNFGVLTARDRATYRRELLGILETKRSSPLKVLEVGFGQGSFLTYCVEQGWEVAGTEISEPLVDAAQKHGFAVKMAQDADFFPEAAFDLIVGFDVIEHIPQTEMLAFLDLLRRKLKHSGTILLRFPNSDCWLGNQNFNGDPTHVTAMGHFKLKYFCQRSALEVIHFGPEARLGFDGGFAKGIHALVAGPIITLLGWIVKALYFPGSQMVLTSANVVAHLKHSPRPAHDKS